MVQQACIQLGQDRKIAATSTSACVYHFLIGKNMNLEYMKLAIEQAKIAESMDEVPIGCIIVSNGEIISRAHNLRHTTKQAIAHAEILAISKACEKLNVWQLTDCDLYVTLEPCPMCAGAILQSRIRNVYFGAYDLKGGSYGSNFNLNEIKNLNHYPTVTGGILEEECSALLKKFFKNKRKIKM